MKKVYTYIDESGIIPLKINVNHKYFVIALVHTEDPKRLSKVFEKSRMKVVKKDKKLLEELTTTKEVKGSHLTEKDKSSIYSDLVRLCNDFEIGIIVMDNMKSSEIFRSKKARCFNYLLKLYFQNFSAHSKLYDKDNQIDLTIDEQNVATKSTHTLCEYINTTLVWELGMYNQEFKVTYQDSKNYKLVQLADFIANTTLRYLTNKTPEAEANMEILLSRVVENKFFKFPL